MRANMWSRILVVLGFFSVTTVQAETPPGQETGTRVVVKLAESSGALPEPEKVVESLVAVGGGERQVRLIRQQEAGVQELTVDLWGNTVPQADVAQTLRTSFPVLATADIQVSTLEAKDRPRREGRGDLVRELRGEGDDVEVKKVVKIIKKKKE
jgi:hypothetical protein